MSKIKPTKERDTERAIESHAIRMSHLRSDRDETIGKFVTAKEKDFARLQNAFATNIDGIWENYIKDKQAIEKQHKEFLSEIDAAYDKHGNVIKR